MLVRHRLAWQERTAGEGTLTCIDERHRLCAFLFAMPLQGGSHVWQWGLPLHAAAQIAKSPHHCQPVCELWQTTVQLAAADVGQQTRGGHWLMAVSREHLQTSHTVWKIQSVHLPGEAEAVGPLFSKQKTPCAAQLACLGDTVRPCSVQALTCLLPDTSLHG